MELLRLRIGQSGQRRGGLIRRHRDEWRFLDLRERPLRSAVFDLELICRMQQLGAKASSMARGRATGQGEDEIGDYRPLEAVGTSLCTE